jgi:hypothetical protein
MRTSATSCALREASRRAGFQRKVRFTSNGLPAARSLLAQPASAHKHTHEGSRKGSNKGYTYAGPRTQLP